MKSSNPLTELTFILHKNSPLRNRKADLGGCCWGRIAPDRSPPLHLSSSSAPPPQTTSLDRSPLRSRRSSVFLEGWGTYSIRAATSLERTSGCASPPLPRPLKCVSSPVSPAPIRGTYFLTSRIWLWRVGGLWDQSPPPPITPQPLSTLRPLPTSSNIPSQDHPIITTNPLRQPEEPQPDPEERRAAAAAAAVCPRIQTRQVKRQALDKSLAPWVGLTDYSQIHIPGVWWYIS